MHHHTAYIKYLCYTCCAFFQTPLIFFYHWTNLVAVCFTMNQHSAYKIPLLHLLRFFFSDFSDFFLSLDKSRCSMFHNESTILHIKYLCYTCCAFFRATLNFFLPLDKSRCSLFHNESSILHIKYLCYTCCAFF